MTRASWLVAASSGCSCPERAWAAAGCSVPPAGRRHLARRGSPTPAVPAQLSHPQGGSTFPDRPCGVDAETGRGTGGALGTGVAGTGPDGTVRISPWTTMRSGFARSTGLVPWAGSVSPWPCSVLHPTGPWDGSEGAVRVGYGRADRSGCDVSTSQAQTPGLTRPEPGARRGRATGPARRAEAGR